MKLVIPKPGTFLAVVSMLILLIGLGSAALIYQRADSDKGDVLGYEMIGGSVYPISPDNSKKYVHDLELYGGKAMVMADEFRRWFAGLWQGKQLAITIACLTIVISAGTLYCSKILNRRFEVEEREK